MNIKIYKDSQLCIVLYEDALVSTIVGIERANNSRISHRLSSSKTVKSLDLKGISYIEELKQLIIEKYESQIEELKSNFVSTKPSDYSDEHNRDIKALKKRIQTVAKRLSEADLTNEDETFNNYLHEVYQLKKQLGSFANEYTAIARKTNGTIKYKIREVESIKSRELSLLDLGILNRVLKNEWEG